MVSTLNHYDGTGYKLHAYVIMPDHLHLLITPIESVEKSMQLIKGGFSFRAKRELEWNGEIWQPGFTDHRIRDEEDWLKHLAYIQNNPVNAHLVGDAAHYEFIGFPSREFPQGLKPGSMGDLDVRAEARTLHSEARTLQPEAHTLQAKARALRVEAEDREDYEAGVAALKECEGQPTSSLEKVMKSLRLQNENFGQSTKVTSNQRQQQKF
jgi:REP element-mobilizing transposase RayT